MLSVLFILSLSTALSLDACLNLEAKSSVNKPLFPLGIPGLHIALASPTRVHGSLRGCPWTHQSDVFSHGESTTQARCWTVGFSILCSLVAIPCGATQWSHLLWDPHTLDWTFFCLFLSFKWQKKTIILHHATYLPTQCCSIWQMVATNY